jgi:hypothetical protein
VRTDLAGAVEPTNLNVSLRLLDRNGYRYEAAAETML